MIHVQVYKCTSVHGNVADCLYAVAAVVHCHIVIYFFVFIVFNLAV